jgi:hypothetical protein
MPATDLTPYCAHCDDARKAALADATTEQERAQALRENPRKIATKTDIDGTKLCRSCFDYRREDRRVDYLEREAPIAVAEADAAFEDD